MYCVYIVLLVLNGGDVFFFVVHHGNDLLVSWYIWFLWQHPLWTPEYFSSLCLLRLYGRRYKETLINSCCSQDSVFNSSRACKSKQYNKISHHSRRKHQLFISAFGFAEPKYGKLEFWSLWFANEKALDLMMNFGRRNWMIQHALREYAAEEKHGRARIKECVCPSTL